MTNVTLDRLWRAWAPDYWHEARRYPGSRENREDMLGDVAVRLLHTSSEMPLDAIRRTGLRELRASYQRQYRARCHDAEVRDRLTEASERLEMDPFSADSTGL